MISRQFIRSDKLHQEKVRLDAYVNSPILMAYPDGDIYVADHERRRVMEEDTIGRKND